MATTPKERNYKGQKIETYASAKDIERLKKICNRYGEIDNIYKLLKYLLDCFLRVADPANDDNNEPVPHAIEEIFISPREYQRLKRLAKKSQSSKKFEVQLLIPFGEYLNKRTKRLIINDEGLRLSDEIQDIFSGNADWEAEPDTTSNHEGLYMKQKVDQRKYKTPDDLK